MAGQVRRRPEEVAAAMATNRDRLAEVYAAYRPWMVRWIAARVRERDRHAAEDLAQNTFLRVWPRLDGSRATGDHGPVYYRLLATIAQGEIADHYRTSTGRQHALEDPVADYSSVSATAGHAAPVVVDAPAGETHSRLREALDGLRDYQRDAVELHIAHGMPRGAVAEELHCSPPTVTRRAQTGLAKLREQLANVSPREATQEAPADPMTRARRAVAQAHQRVTTQAAQTWAQQAARSHADDHAAEHAAVLDTDSAQ
jgi:RNA polymerase sigma factor (sigma-70 family)